MAKTLPPVSDVVAKWQRNTGNAQQYYTAGVQRATGWADAAVAAGPRRDAGLQAAIADGRINAGITRVGDAGWKSKTLAVGPANWAAAVQKSGDAFARGLNTVYGMLQTAQSATSSIDTSTFEGRMQKMVEHARAMHDAAVARKRGG
jgi:hypothetical protein